MNRSALTSHKEYDISNRLKRLPPYLFAEIDKKKSCLRKKGIPFIDLSIGDPDSKAPLAVVQALARSAKLKENQKYALDQGKYTFRKSIQRWFRKRFDVKLDETTQILPLIGSKEGLVHLPLGFVNPKEYVLIPCPGYPGYRSAGVLSGANIYEMPLLETNSFLPDFKKIPLTIRNKSKIMYLNYPNNPTTSVAPLSFLKEVVSFCARYGIIVAYDNAYSEIYFDKKPHSILEVKGAKEVAIEFHSLSKTFCITGFRVGWACGNERLVSVLLKVKTNVDSGIFGAVQEAGAHALNTQSMYVGALRNTIQERRDFFVAALREKGFTQIHCDATFYVWVKMPLGLSDSIAFTKSLIARGVVATPGIGFGRYGEGFIRFALTVDKKQLKKALTLF